MEQAYNNKTQEYFKVSDDDFDAFQTIFSKYDVRSVEGIAIYCEGESFERKYTEDEIAGIFDLHAEYTGLDKEIAKDNVVEFSDRSKAEEELKLYIKDKTPISIESAEALLKVLEAFDSYECTIENG